MSDDSQFSDGYSFEDAESIAFEFERLMHSHGIAIRSGSALEQLTLNVYRLLYEFRGQSRLDPSANLGDSLRDLIGLTEMARHLLAVRFHDDFDQLLPHLRLLNEGAAIQNAPSSQRDSATNKLFELLVATWAMNCGTAVRLDHPDHSAGDNPDVLATIGGRRWGFACKVLHSLHLEGLIEHVEKGIDQIERSEAEVGIVCFNLKNVIQHGRYWQVLNEAEWKAGAEPEYGAYVDPHEPFRMLAAEVSSIATRLREYLPKGHFATLVQGHKALPGYLLWAHTFSGVRIGDRPAPLSVRLMTMQASANPSAEDEEVLECLNRATRIA